MYSEYLDSFVISVDEIATEGYNINTTKLIKNNEKRTQVIEAKARIRALIKEGKRNKDPKPLRAALREIDKAKKLIMSFKEEIDKLDEPDTFGAKAAGWFFPIIDFRLPEAETTAAGNVIISTHYTDVMSETTDSTPKQSYQYRMNYTLKYLDDYKMRINKLIRRFER